MKKLLTCLPLMLLVVLVAAAASGADPEATQPKETQPDHPQMVVEPFAEFVTPSDTLPRLRFFADNKISLNDRCPVRRVKLNCKMGADRKSVV